MYPDTGPSTERPTRMPTVPIDEFTYERLSEIALDDLVSHMSDPRMAEHMPLLTEPFGEAEARAFVTAKEVTWARDGLGHWAILHKGRYVGWGGFQKEGEEWDFGLVLKPDAFGHGVKITCRLIELARTDPRIPYVTFLLPPSRQNLDALARVGARFLGEVEHEGAVFRKYRLDMA